MNKFWVPRASGTQNFLHFPIQGAPCHIVVHNFSNLKLKFWDISKILLCMKVPKKGIKIDFLMRPTILVLWQPLYYVIEKLLKKLHFRRAKNYTWTLKSNQCAKKTRVLEKK